MNSELTDDYIETYSGVKVYILNPIPESIRILDIAHALSNICRFTGHVSKFYSVAEHCLNVSYMCVENPLWGLLHDASEAYLMDIASPVKKYLTNYKSIESRFMDAVCKRFSIEKTMPAEVHKADLIMLHAEANVLIPSGGRTWKTFSEEYLKQFKGKIHCYSREEAKEKFIQRYFELTSS